MSTLLRRFHVAGGVALLTSIVGGLSASNVVHLFPEKVAAALLVTGVVLQAFTKPVTAGGTDLVPKQPPIDLTLPPPDSAA